MEEQVVNGAAVDESAILAEPDPLAGLSVEEAEVAAKLLPLLAEKANQLAYARAGADYRIKWDQEQEQNRLALKAQLDEMRQILKPLTEEEIGTLLEQEYSVHKLKLAGPEGTVEFTIRELSIASEKKLIKTIKVAVGPVLKLISSAEWTAMAGTSQLERIDKVIDLIPESMDVLTECTAVCLNPRNQTPFMTAEWVKENMSLGRIVNVLTAQVSASRYRDFYSLASRLFKQTRMMQ